MRKLSGITKLFRQLPKPFYAAVVAVCLTTSSTHLWANSETEALLDLLVKKGVVTNREADALAAKAAQDAKDNKNVVTDYGIDNKFLIIDKYVKSIKLYGDSRFRYDYRTGEATDAPDYSDRARIRYRLRLNLDAQLNDDWFFGFRLETSNNSRTANVNFGQNPPFFKANSTTSTTVVTGKTVVTKVDFGSTVFVGQVYLRYSPTDWLTIEGGRMPMPLVTTTMLWDLNINPEGFAEQFKFTLGGSQPATTSYSKDGKSYTAPAPASGFSVDLFANFGQFFYDEGDPQNAFGSTPNHRDAWLLCEQVGAKFNFNQTTYFQLAPTFMTYTNRGNDFVGDYSGDPGENQIGINDLMVLDIPAELGFQAFGLPFVVFGDFAYNADAQGRAARAGHPDLGSQSIAWQAGINVGTFKKYVGFKKQGDWCLRAFYQHTDAYALDANLVDADVFDARLNMQGVVVRGEYALTDFLSFDAMYNFGNRLEKNIGTGGAGGGLATNPLKDYNMLLVEVNVKF